MEMNVPSDQDILENSVLVMADSAGVVEEDVIGVGDEAETVPVSEADVSMREQDETGVVDEAFCPAAEIGLEDMDCSPVEVDFKGTLGDMITDQLEIK